MLENTKRSLDEIAKSMEKSRKNREYLIKSSRDVISLCSRSIIKAHAGDIKEAHELASKAKSLLGSMRTKTTAPLRGQLLIAEQELVEALALIAIIKKNDIPSMKSMSVSGGAYVLGLLDCIGELKRRVLDNIRVGKPEEAVRIFEIMNNLYEQLYPFAAYDKIVKEARRKLDVNRELIERARFAVSESAERARLEKKIDEIVSKKR